MTTILLLRHAAHDLLGNTLAGRTNDVALNAAGMEQAHALASRLSRFPLRALYCSPRVRARQTLAPLAAATGLPLQIDAAIDEVDFGSWSGRRFSELALTPGWDLWCNRRSEAQPPGGEAIAEVQVRIVGAIASRVRMNDGGTIALCTHGDVVKCALADYLGTSLDHLERFDIAPASLSIVQMHGDWVQVTRVNDTGTLDPEPLAS